MTFQGKEITLENLSPVFTPEQEAAKRRELEQQLYEVFRKYADKRESEEAGTVVVKHFCNTLFENSPGISSFKWCFPIIVGMRTDMIVPYVHISV